MMAGMAGIRAGFAKPGNDQAHKGGIFKNVCHKIRKFPIFSYTIKRLSP